MASSVNVLSREESALVWEHSVQKETIDIDGSISLLLGESEEYGNFCIVDSALGNRIAMIKLS